MSNQAWDPPYPRPWSPWEWIAKNNYGRSREIAPGVYDWEYQDFSPADAHRLQMTQATPRNREVDPSPSTIRDSDDVVSEISGRFQNTYIGGSRPREGNSRQEKYNEKDASVPISPRREPSGSMTPVVQFKGQNETRITTQRPDRDHEKKDPTFRVHNSDNFKFGKVFKMMWSEPVGSGGTVITGAEQKGFQKLRRFIVIDTRNGHSICLSILTYGGKATTKKGAHPEDHAAVYSNGSKPNILPKERMTKKPVKIDPKTPADKLDPLSRLNYAKIYTVEHNVKVKFIGHVNRSYEQVVVLDYNATHRPIADSKYEMRTCEEEDREHETRNSEGANPMYQGGQESFVQEGQYSAVGSSNSQPLWITAGSSNSQAPLSTGLGPVATSSYGSLAVSTWRQCPSYEQETEQHHDHDRSLYDAD